MVARRILIAFACLVFIPLASPGQTRAQADDAEPIVYGVYLKCDLSQTERINAIIGDTWGSIAAPHVEAGHIGTWGLLEHNTGGEWTHVLYHAGLDRAALLTALDGMVAAFASENTDEFEAFWSACQSHEDYMWMRQMGSMAGADIGTVSRPAAGMSTYWVCEEGRGALIDLLAETVFAPALNAQVEAGTINSWAWWSHFVGGKYRRLLVTDGASAEALLSARDEIIAATSGENAQLAAEFSRVCNGHTDYIWNVIHSGP